MEAKDLFQTTGIIVPTRWDSGGGVVAVAIATYAEEELPVANLEELPELRQHLKRQIALTGTLSEDDGETSVVIHRYRLYDDGPVACLIPGQVGKGSGNLS